MLQLRNNHRMQSVIEICCMTATTHCQMLIATCHVLPNCACDYMTLLDAVQIYWLVVFVSHFSANSIRFWFSYKTHTVHTLSWKQKSQKLTADSSCRILALHALNIWGNICMGQIRQGQILCQRKAFDFSAQKLFGNNYYPASPK